MMHVVIAGIQAVEERIRDAMRTARPIRARGQEAQEARGHWQENPLASVQHQGVTAAPDQHARS